ncbi:MAG: dTDP-4-dehydrorhamnose reductase [Thermoplasmata archaeon]
MDEKMDSLLVIGASGLLGSKIMEQARGRYAVRGAYNPDVDGATLWQLDSVDIGSKDDIDKLFDKIKPDKVILTAAMTNVDACEKNPTLANRINAAAPGLVARACKKASASLVHVSTDYVFDGMKSRKYIETDVQRPISVYGTSKLAGERSVLATLPEAAVVRPAVLYGWNPIPEKMNFVTWVLKKLRNNESVKLFEDQIVSPTLADDLAGVLLDLAEKQASGVWHASGPDCLDRPSCGRMIAEVFGLDEGLIAPVPSSSVSLPARRPKYSCLDITKTEKFLGRKTVSFKDGLIVMRQQEKLRA